MELIVFLSISHSNGCDVKERELFPVFGACCFFMESGANFREVHDVPWQRTLTTLKTLLQVVRLKGIKIMRELNEQELEQVAGGRGFTFTYLANEQAGGAVIAGNGIAYSQSFGSSTYGPASSSSIAANKGFAYGSTAAVQSEAISTSSVIITGH